MPTYYVRPDGNNANAGTGPSAGSAWQTIAKALGASGIASGDTLYIMSGTYREAVTVNMTSATVETLIIGDVGGSIFGGSGGEVIWSGFTTDDNTAPTGVPLNLNGRDYLTFRDIVFHGDDVSSSSSSCVIATTATSTNIRFTRCGFACQGSARSLTAVIANQVVANWIIEECTVWGRGSGFVFEPSTTGAPDWDLQIQIRNCLFTQAVGRAVAVVPSGTGTGKAGGIDVFNCTSISTGGLMVTNANSSTTYPCTVTNCLIIGSTVAGLAANASGQITSSYNRLIDNVSTFTNVTAGIGDVTAGIHGIDGGVSFVQGFNDRLYFMPAVSGILSGDGTASGAPSTDIIGETRPNPPAVGAYEDTDVTPAASGGGLPIFGGGIIK